ncbi:MAG: NADH-quinone oxidoreductase subunit N, partial [Planctomycetales bacterium]|nr:NADH-quinone oxidoreductase subunit N [Planctomycetales bacterium]
SVAPELVICITIFALLLIRTVTWNVRFDLSWIAIAGSLTGLVYAAPWKQLTGEVVTRHELFSGMLVYDGLGIYVRALLLFFLFLFVVFTRISGIPDRQDGADFYCMVFGATLGMCLMATANHLLMVFMAVEMASVPSYALAAMLKGRREASEAALKYSVYGAGAAGVMLYGISLVAGLLNTCHLPTAAVRLAEVLPTLNDQQTMILALGSLMIAAGLAFKLSAVPFHFWCPDVFQGASAEVNAFLSVASKAGALALLLRVALGFGYRPETIQGPPLLDAPGSKVATIDAQVGHDSGLMSVADETVSTLAAVAVESDESALANTEQINTALAPAREYMALLIAFLSIITCTFGNLAAYGQTNIKRLLAYSTIAHAGYMMMPVPVALSMAGEHPDIAKQAVASLALYMGIYLFMNLGAFAVVAFLRNTLRSEEIDSYAGLIRKSPGVVILFATILFSLVGLPPLAGFLGKFAVFAAIADAYTATSKLYLVVLLVAGGINTAISLFYYLRVVKVMTIDPEPADRPTAALPMLSLSGLYLFLIAAPIVMLFVSPNVLSNWAAATAAHLF